MTGAEDVDENGHEIPHLVDRVCMCTCDGCMYVDREGTEPLMVYCTCLDCEPVRCGLHLPDDGGSAA